MSSNEHRTHASDGDSSASSRRPNRPTPLGERADAPRARQQLAGSRPASRGASAARRAQSAATITVDAETVEVKTSSNGVTSNGSSGNGASGNGSSGNGAGRRASRDEVTLAARPTDVDDAADAVDAPDAADAAAIPATPRVRNRPASTRPRKPSTGSNRRRRPPAPAAEPVEPDQSVEAPVIDEPVVRPLATTEDIVSTSTATDDSGGIPFFLPPQFLEDRADPAPDVETETEADTEFDPLLTPFDHGAARVDPPRSLLRRVRAVDAGESAASESTATQPATSTTRIRVTTGMRPRRPRLRRVTRIVRHVDPWSVFKVALCFSAVLYGVCLTAGVLLWNVAYTTGTVDNVERFFESFGWDSFEFNGGELYHHAWIAGLFIALGLTGFIVLAATLFNLITDLVGGVRVSVLEEEVVERDPAMRRTLLRRLIPTVDDFDDPAPPAAATPEASEGRQPG